MFFPDNWLAKLKYCKVFSIGCSLSLRSMEYSSFGQQVWFSKYPLRALHTPAPLTGEIQSSLTFSLPHVTDVRQLLYRIKAMTRNGVFTRTLSTGSTWYQGQLLFLVHVLVLYSRYPFLRHRSLLHARPKFLNCYSNMRWCSSTEKTDPYRLVCCEHRCMSNKPIPPPPWLRHNHLTLLDN